MKKHKTEENKDRKRKELVKRIQYEELKRGINKKKEDYEEQRWNRYVRSINAYYEIFKPEKKVYNTAGSKKEGRHTYPTKSQLDWKNDEKEKYILVKKNRISQKSGKKYQAIYKYKLNIRSTNPELIYIKRSLEEEEIRIPPREEKVLLFIDDYFIYRTVKISPGELFFMSKIKLNKKKISVGLEKYFPELDKEYTSIYGKMTGEEILKTVLGTKAKMYKVYIDIEESEGGSYVI